jgi:K+-sensing histidine kinase KdpD
VLQALYLVLPFIVFVIHAFLAALVVRTGRASQETRAFALFLVAMASWGLTVFGMRSSPNVEVAWYWEQVVFISITLASITFYRFSIRFTGMRAPRGLMNLLYALLVVVAVLGVTGYIAPRMQVQFYGYAPVLGPAFPLYLAGAYLPFFLAVGVLVRRFRELSGSVQQARIGYVLMGAFLSVVGATTDFLPSLGVAIYPLGIVMNIGFGAIATLAVVRYKLLDLTALLRRGAAYFAATTAIFGAYGAIMLVFFLLFRSQSALAAELSAVAALLVVALVLQPVLTRFQSSVDRFFFREQADQLTALREFSAIDRDITDLSGLVENILDIARRLVRAQWVALLLPDHDQHAFVSAGATAGAPDTAVSLPTDAWVVSWLTRHGTELEERAIAYDPFLQGMQGRELDALRRAGFSMLVPLRSQGDLSGVLVLGPSLVRPLYTRTDLDLLLAFAGQTATVVENSRLYQRELERLAELEQLSDLKSNLLRTVSHELKSPITAVKAAVGLLTTAEQELTPRNRERLMRSLTSGVDRLERLVGESLEYAQMRSNRQDDHRSIADMGEIISRAVAVAQPAFSVKDQTLNVSVPSGLPPLLLDAHQIERVVANLLSNANKFTPKGGTISISAAEEKGYVIVQVADNGRGIPEIDQPHVFSEYYRGSNADSVEGAGTGLGLTIARSLVEAHGGSLTLSSRVGVGTTFALKLPTTVITNVVSAE